MKRELKERLSRLIPDSIYVKRKYRLTLGKKLDLRNPRTFNEKIQWLKLHERKDVYTTMVDKALAKKHIAKIIGEDYIIPTLGIWNEFEEINFSELPSKFVLKCTHDSGGVLICKNKERIDVEEAKKQLTKSLKKNFYYYGREWPYKNVKPRIIAEQYMEDDSEELSDYKIHCFNGIPKMILVCKNRFSETGMTEDFFDTEWNHLDVRRKKHGNAPKQIEKPAELDELISLAKKLSCDIPFLRVDFYIINHRIYFGEMTFYPASGFEGFYPEEYDRIFGDWLKLPSE